MPRTTLSLDEDIIRDLRLQAARERTSLARLANRLLRSALRGGQRPKAPRFVWKVHHCGRPKVDLNDRDALYDAMDRPCDS